MKGVWGKIDPHKRINTFEVSLLNNNDLGVWFRLYV